MKYEKEFRAEHPETIGEKDSAFDMHNYYEWLEILFDKLESEFHATDEILRTLHFKGELPAPFPTRSQLDKNRRLLNRPSNSTSQ